MSFIFEEATKEKAKGRIALIGPSGSGKTYTALKLATAFGGPIAVVDSERGSASKYSGRDGFKFKVLNLDRFDPRKVPDLIRDATPICGEGTLILDSFTAWWSGVGGMQELVDSLSKGGNSFQAWGKARPFEKAMFDAILNFPGHVIVTMRAKTAYEINEVNGKKTITKLGLAPEQRQGVEFEFDIVGDMDQDNVLSISKSRCTPIRERGRFPHPGTELAKMMLDWLNDGVAPAKREATPDAFAAAVDHPEIVALLRSVFASARNPADLDEAVKQARKAKSDNQISDATNKELGALYKARKAEIAAAIAKASEPEVEAEGTAAAQ